MSENCEAVIVTFAPYPCPSEVVAWRDGPRHLRPVDRKRIRSAARRGGVAGAPPASMPGHGAFLFILSMLAGLFQNLLVASVHSLLPGVERGAKLLQPFWMLLRQIVPFAEILRQVV